MDIRFNRRDLEELLKDFYILTGMRIVLFDTEHNELAAFPNTDCRFCKQMKADPDRKRLCDISDRKSFEICRESKEYVVYHCHSGLIEATAPLIDSNAVIGYLMFGQISDAVSTQELAGILQSENISDIPLKTKEQIYAAARLIQALTFYTIFKETIYLQRTNFKKNFNDFLSEHLSDELSVDYIALSLGIGKTKLYDSCKKYLGCSVASHIKNLRIEEAKRLLKDTALSVAEISERVGFSDYNYFCRVFKRETGISAKKYRKSFN